MKIIREKIKCIYNLLSKKKQKQEKNKTLHVQVPSPKTCPTPPNPSIETSQTPNTSPETSSNPPKVSTTFQSPESINTLLSSLIYTPNISNPISDSNTYCIYNKLFNTSIPEIGWFKSCFFCKSITAKTNKYIYNNKLYIVYTCPKCKYQINTNQFIKIYYKNNVIKYLFKALYELNIICEIEYKKYEKYTNNNNTNNNNSSSSNNNNNNTRTLTTAVITLCNYLP